MESSIGEPFVLSSYDSPSKLPKGSENVAGAYASYDQASASSEGYATVAAQGNGVHVLDLSSLHPVASYNLGPTTTFACAPVSEFSMQGSHRHCATYASVASSSQTTSIMLWKENLSSPLADRASQKGKSFVIPHAVSHLHKLSELPSRVFALSKYGDVSILGSDGEIHSTYPASTQEETVFQNFWFSREDCSFVPPSSHLAIWTQLRLSKQNARLWISAIDEQANFVALHDLEVPLQSEKVLRASLSSSGHLSVLSHDGSWHLLQIEPCNTTSLRLITVVEPIYLATLSFLSSAPDEVSILSCGTSLVLLAGITKAREIVLLLWDLQYSVLLASHTFPIPSQSNSTVPISLDLIESSTSQILLVVSPIVRKSKEKTGSLRSSIFVVPITLPKKSTIANAMGRASAGVQWLARVESGLDGAHEKLLAEMQTAMQQGRPNAAATAFLEWEKKAKQDDSAEPLELGQVFVKSLLNVVLQPSQSSNLIYSSEVVQNLLDRRVISASMIEAGLLRILRLRNDWKSIEKALLTVLDFSEMEIIETLTVVVAHHKKSTSPSDDAMQVDVDIPALPHFLALCVKFPTSSAALRLAIRRYLTDGDDLLCILQVIDSWFTSWASKEVKLLPSKKSLVKNEFGILVVEPETHEKVDSESDALPSLRNIVNFLQCILDASFVSLVQHTASHHLLRKLQGHIEPQVFTLEQNERLRGSLLPFVKLQARALRDAKNGIANDGKPAQQEDWRQRKKQMHEQAGMAIGVYQVEELVL